MQDVAAEISVSPAEPGDADELGRLGALLVALHHQFDRQRFLSATPTTAQAYAKFLVGQLANPHAILLVARRGGAICGYAYAALEGTDYMALRGPAGALYDLVVDPASRRQGIGRLLLERVIATLAARGAPRIVLFTAEKNEAARKLFSSTNFRPTMVEMTRELHPD